MATLLLVDDEVDAINILKLTLENAGFDVLTAEDGRKGFDAARRFRPDIIITDVLMPVLDGYGFYKELKGDPATKNIPVIILTARGAMEAAFEAVGVDCFMEKPVEGAVLIKKVQELLSRSAVPSSQRGRQKVLVAGTYPEVVREICDYIESLGHEALGVYTAEEVIRQSVEKNQDVFIIEVQMEDGTPSADIIRAIRILPKLKKIPILLYSYYRVSDLGNSDFRNRILDIEKAKDACMAAGAVQYFDRYNCDLFKEWIVKYL